MSKNPDIKKTKQGYTFLGLPDNYYLPTYEEALKEYNYRKNLRDSESSGNKYNGASIKTIGGVQIDPKNYRRYIVQVRKQRAGKDSKLTKYTSNGSKSLNLKAGELFVQTGKYYLDTKTFIPDLISVDPSYKIYSTQLTVNSSNLTKKQKMYSSLPVKTMSYKLKSKKPIKNKSKRVTNTSFIPKNDLDFINQYVLAYQNREQDPEKYNAFNRALSKNPSKNVMWHGIWSGIDPSHTLELSDTLHEMLYTIHPGTKNEMGQMNWYNIFNGNLLHATADDLSIPRSSLDYVSPERRAKTIQMTTPSSQVSNEGTQSIDNSNTIDDIISQNLDLFRSQYEYAKLHNKAFNYLSSAFDTTNLNVNYKYGGIGDFMDTYGISPLYLYDKLKAIYE